MKTFIWLNQMLMIAILKSWHYFMEKAFAQGALDVFFTPIFMKKNRPGVRLSLLAPCFKIGRTNRLLFSETTAIGVTLLENSATEAGTEMEEVRIWKMSVKIKESFLDGKLYNYQPEFEDCKMLAEKLKKPFKEVIAAAIQAYRK